MSPREFARRKRAAKRDRKHGRGLSWLKYVDSKLKKEYYVNEATGETAWEVPVGALIVTVEADGRSSYRRQSVWEDIIDEETGEVYVCNRSTNKTFWERPDKDARISVQL